MKVLKVIGGILVAILALVFIGGSMLPSSYQVERSINIDARPDAIFKHVNTLAGMDTWSPWNERDPNMEKSIEGTDGTVGAIAKWSSPKEDVGTGSQKITAIEENKRIDTHLHFIKPFESESDAYVTLDADPADKGTKVTWGFAGENGIVARVMFFLMGVDLDEAVGPDYEKGLAKLKAIVEAEAAANTSVGNYKIQQIDYPGQKFVTMRKRIGWAEMGDYFTTNMPKTMGIVQANKMQMTGAPVGLYYEWDVENEETDMATAIPVAALPKDLPDVATGVALDASKALQIDHYGDMAKSGDAHNAMEAYAKANNITLKAPCMEVYMTDPTTEPDTAKWLTQVVYFY